MQTAYKFHTATISFSTVGRTGSQTARAIRERCFTEMGGIEENFSFSVSSSKTISVRFLFPLPPPYLLNDSNIENGFLPDCSYRHERTSLPAHVKCRFRFAREHPGRATIKNGIPYRNSLQQNKKSDCTRNYLRHDLLLFSKYAFRNSTVLYIMINTHCFSTIRHILAGVR